MMHLLLVLPGNKLLDSKIGREFSYSFGYTLKIGDITSINLSDIFHIGDKDANSCSSWSMVISKNNNLMVRINTYNRPNNKNKTKSGLTCQNWTSKYPHTNSKYTEENFP